MPARKANPDFVAEYLAGLARQTARSYRTSLNDFAEFMGEETVWGAAQSLVSQGQFGSNMLAGQYRKSLIDRGLSGSSVNVRLSAVKGLFGFMKVLGLVNWDLQVKGVKVENYKETKGPGVGAVKEILDEVSKGKCAAKRERDEVIIRLLYDCGLRRSEASSLELSDVDFHENRIQIRGKGRHDSEWIPAGQRTMDALRRWITARGHWDGPLFVKFRGQFDGSVLMRAERLTDYGLYWIVGQYGKQIGKKVRPHGLRHSAITEALNKTGGDVVSVAAFSRHKNLNTVKVYDDNRQERARKVTEMICLED